MPPSAPASPAFFVHFEWLQPRWLGWLVRRRVAIVRLFAAPFGPFAADGQPVKPFCWSCVAVFHGSRVTLKAALAALPAGARRDLIAAGYAHGARKVAWERWGEAPNDVRNVHRNVVRSKLAS